MKAGVISNIQKYSLQDGPGIRTTVFLKGCPLDCWWCHNPEGRSSRPEVLVVESRCARCGECVKHCPEADDDFAAETNLLPPSHCSLCGACLQACPTGARQMIGRRMSVEEVLEEIARDRIFYEESGGGVTFSGGEPLMQAEFVEALLKECRRMGIHTALDTCGFAPPDTALKIARLADLVLYDVKLVDEEAHEKYTGVSNRLILDNLRALSARPIHLWIRIPIIPGINDQPEQLEAMIKLIRSLGKVQQINLLPYHQTGIAKFSRLGLNYRLPHVATPSEEYMEAVAARFEGAGLNAKVGG